MKNFKVLSYLILSISLLTACSSEVKPSSEKQSSNGKIITCEDEDIPENAHWKETNATSLEECEWQCNDSHSLHEGVCYIKTKDCTNTASHIISGTQTYVPETAGQYSACSPNPNESITKVPTVQIDKKSNRNRR